MIREFDVSQITDAVKNAFIKINIDLPEDSEKAIQKASLCETSETGKAIFEDMQKNILIAREKNIPVCQDTGMAVIFAEIGRNIHLSGDFEAAVNAGVAQGYCCGYLRKSIVSDPLKRENTNDNTPAVIHIKIVEGSNIRLTMSAKGFGSENMSALKMFNPSADVSEIAAFVAKTAADAGGNPCPPVVVGVGIGGTSDAAARLAKYALCRDTGVPSSDPFYASLEKDMLERINDSGTGPQGLGGRVSALAVHIEVFPTHIAGLPVAVNFNCHVNRHITVIL